VLDKIGEVFGQALEASGIHWNAITDPAQRRRIALQVLQQVPVLWIWDNVEPITGFPAGTPSDWNAAEQQELRTFLSEARETKAKLLLTSRRDEMAWLGELPRRVAVPDMPMQERLQLAGAIVERRGRRLADLPDLTPLLRFTRGNPLTVLVTVGEALSAAIDTPSQLAAFVDALERGEVALGDEASEGRSKSLGASLSYGFSTAFTHEERRVLALLHLFQGFVDVEVLRAMGNLDSEHCLATVRGLTRKQGIALLDRAAEIGLLHALGGGCYGIHPALPWYFREMFCREFSEESGEANEGRRAFAVAIGILGEIYHNAWAYGSREVLVDMMAEQDNLLAALHLARTYGWWPTVLCAMQGLRHLYNQTGRGTAWRGLVYDVLPDLMDPTSDGPLAGRDDLWRIVGECRGEIALQEGELAEAERMQQVCVDWDLQRAQPAFQATSEGRDEELRHVARTLGASKQSLAYIQRQRRNPSCAANLRDALEYARAIGDTLGQATSAYNLGHVYIEIPELRNLDEAEGWFLKSVELHDPDDGIGRSRCIGSLGLVARERFKEAATAGRPAEELVDHLLEAARLYEQSLEMIPATNVVDRGINHHQLGIIYGLLGDIDRALHHYQLDIRLCEQAGDIKGAGIARQDAAKTLGRAGRLSDARAYAEAALANFRTFGDRAANDIKSVEELIAKIDQDIAEEAGV
jgi:tetratricopeptide (TPR) repeat protein